MISYYDSIRYFDLESFFVFFFLMSKEIYFLQQEVDDLANLQLSRLTAGESSQDLGSETPYPCNSIPFIPLEILFMLAIPFIEMDS